jgi:hypothetical protein
MEAGLMIRWGAVQPGREEQALALFDETVGYYGSLIEAGRLTSFEPFFITTSDLETELGFFIAKGPVAEIFAVMDSDEHKSFVIKASLLLHHVRIDMLTVGDGIGLELERFNKERTALNI